MRAHCNVLSDTPFPFPLNPDYVDLTFHYPNIFAKKYEVPDLQKKRDELFLNTRNHALSYSEKVKDEFNGKGEFKIDFVDIGCGYGGLLFALSPHFPNMNMMGFEIRDVIAEYVGKKIRAKRILGEGFDNISILRTNTMKHLTNYIR